MCSSLQAQRRTRLVQVRCNTFRTDGFCLAITGKGTRVGTQRLGVFTRGKSRRIQLVGECRHDMATFCLEALKRQCGNGSDWISQSANQCTAYFTSKTPLLAVTWPSIPATVFEPLCVKPKAWPTSCVLCPTAYKAGYTGLNSASSEAHVDNGIARSNRAVAISWSAEASPRARRAPGRASAPRVTARTALCSL